ncbi:MAG: hypothetical protein J5879_05340 [Clostridia bacterium]|nr:hypothetical protein [Clostridia bacterium]
MKKMGIRLTLKDEGYDVYAPMEGQTWGYRYGPSIMVYDDMRADAWFASPGALGEADWFTYRHTEDGGKTWSDEVVVLTPTADSMDLFSVCDPAVIKFGGYYYIGYTSTIFTEGGGVCNNCFVARSKNPDGPFEKWTGDGWGEQRTTEDGQLRWMGKPAPVIYFDGDCAAWGEGEFSFVVSNDVLYMYYTKTSYRQDGSRFSQTMAATADATDEMWPAKIRQRGVAAERTGSGNDSFDVVYSDEFGKFIAISTDRRFTKESMLAIYESDNGLRFRRCNELRKKAAFMCHNSGISGDELHHVKKGDLKLLGYAYGDKWGFWGTRFHEYTLSKYYGFYSENDKTSVELPVIPKPRREPYSINIMPKVTPPRFYKLRQGEELDIEFVWFDSAYSHHKADGVTIDNYDKSVARFDGCHVRALNVGYTFADAKTPDGRSAEILIYVYPEDFDFSEENKYPVSLEPVQETYKISLKENERKQLRALIQYSNGTWAETGKAADGVVYYGYNEELISVDENGIISTKGIPGTTRVKVGAGSFEISYTVKINKI